MSHSVFISYARTSSRTQAEALHRELIRDGLSAFLDYEEIRFGERFPDALLEALLSASVVVVFADEVYFQRWHCLTELRIALVPVLALPPGAPHADVEAALSSLVLALPAESLPRQELERLPGPLRALQWPRMGDTLALTSLVRARLAQGATSLGQRLEATGGLSAFRARYLSEFSMPPPGNLAGRRLYPLELEPSLGNAFVGRGDELWRLDFMLSTLRGEAGTNPAPAVALEGGGGFGKTRLALEYVHRFGPSRFPGGILWIDADAGEARLEVQHYEALRSFRPQIPDLRTFKEQERSASAELAQALHTLPADEPLLFVVDNIPEPEPGKAPSPLRRYCPAIGKVALLVTSRSRVSTGEPGVQSLSVDTLAHDAAVSLLTQGLEGTGVLAETWDRIADWVGQLPLALELLNRVLLLGGLTADELLQRAERVGPAGELDRQMDALRGQIPEGRLRGITEALAISYERLTEDQRKAARLIAQLSPAPILFETLKALEPEGFLSAIRSALVARSFVTRIRGQETHWLGRMHRVLADFLRSQSPDPVEEALHVCRGFVKLLPPPFIKDPRVWPLVDLHFPHVEWVFHTLSQEERLSDEISFVKLGLTIGEFLLATGNLDGALNYAGWLHERTRKSPGLEDDWGLAAINLHATVLQERGETSIAREMKEKVVQHRRQTLGDEHPDTLLAINNLAVALQAEGRWREALEHREQVLTATQRTLDPDHPYTRSAMSNLAQSLLLNGELARARELTEQYLESLRRQDGDDSPDVLSAMGNLAAVLEAQGNAQGARALEEQVMEGRLRLFGDEHEATQKATINLAATLRTLGDFRRSRELLERVLEVRLRTLGEEHPDTLHTLSDLAVTLHDMGELRKSRELKERVLAIRVRTQGEAHPRTLMEMNNLAVTLTLQGEPAASLQLAERALELSRQKLGEKVPLTLALMSTLALALEALGKHAQGRLLREQEVKILVEQVGESHPTTLSAKTRLAHTLLELGELRSASELLERTIEGLSRTQGPEHPDTLQAMRYLADIFLHESKLQRAKKMYEQLLAVNQRVYGPNHLNTLATMNNLAGVLQRQGKPPKARALYEKTLRASTQAHGTENPYTTLTAWNLFRLLMEMNAYAAADEVLVKHVIWLLERDPRTLMASLQPIRAQVQQLLARYL